MSRVLKKIGLTRQEVRDTIGFPQEPFVDGCRIVTNNYLCGTDQKRIRRRMKEYTPYVVARYLEGWHPGTISRLLGVSEESVRGTLRKTKVFNKKKPGRPPKSESSLQGSQSKGR